VSVSAMLRAVAFCLDGQVRLRVYNGGRLEVEVPLDQRRALGLPADLLNAALLTRPADELLELEASGQERVAQRLEDLTRGGYL
jgi:hypothetical protein